MIYWVSITDTAADGIDRFICLSAIVVIVFAFLSPYDVPCLILGAYGINRHYITDESLMGFKMPKSALMCLLALRPLRRCASSR